MVSKVRLWQGFRAFMMAMVVPSDERAIPFAYQAGGSPNIMAHPDVRKPMDRNQRGVSHAEF